MMIEIKSLKEQIPIKLEQYICEECEKKSYINTEDKTTDFLNCPFCGIKSKNIRIFEINIIGIGEY